MRTYSATDLTRSGPLFLDELGYSAGRDTQITRIVPTLVLLFPREVVDTVAAMLAVVRRSTDRRLIRSRAVACE
ncbi:hypothetical protein QTI24_29750 [Variovorax sp. J22P240]|uniref:hypothetical protein n=1 Tax=Variovorax sp. J22P240 TaxID=3053514 RepID=UPI002577848B|nr:hypothetical protein [Variovorax sp. J22P240]MDM0002808.1 hypothetical protein [Variovorax sp. J22P240]